MVSLAASRCAQQQDTFPFTPVQQNKMDRMETRSAYQQLLDAANTPDSQLAGSENQQMTPQNTLRARQPGRSPSELHHNQMSHGSQYFRTGLDQVHRQHSQQQQEKQLYHRPQTRQPDFGPQERPQQQQEHKTRPRQTAYDIELQRQQRQQQQQPQHHRTRPRQSAYDIELQRQQRQQHRQQQRQPADHSTRPQQPSFSPQERPQQQQHQQQSYYVPQPRQAAFSPQEHPHQQQQQPLYYGTAFDIGRQIRYQDQQWQQQRQQQQQQQHQMPYYRNEPLHTGFGLHQNRSQAKSRDIQPPQTGQSQPQQNKRKRQPSYDGTESLQTHHGQPHLLPSRGLESLPSHDYQPLHGGLVQPRLQRGQLHTGSSPGQTAYGYPYVLERQPRYDSQPRRADFGQPPTQHQQPNLSFDYREPAFTRPQPSYQQSRTGFQPLKTGWEQPWTPYDSLLDEMSKDKLRKNNKDRGEEPATNQSYANLEPGHLEVPTTLGVARPSTSSSREITRPA